MALTVYVREDCHDCEKVLAWLDAHHVQHDIDDVDAPRNPKVPRLFIAPALCDGPRLLAYGMDIIAWAQKNGKIR